MKHLYRYLTLLAALLGGAAAPHAAQAQSRLLVDTNNLGPNSGWEIVARDEFLGSTLNTTYWQTTPQDIDPKFGWGSEMYDASDATLVTVWGGAAHLKAVRRKDDAGNPYDESYWYPGQKTPRTIRYRAGMLCSTAGSPFQMAAYGMWEASLRLPANGEEGWPTFWLAGAPSQPYYKSDSTEIDILDGARVNNQWTYPGLLSGVINWGKSPKQECLRRSKVWSGEVQQASLLSRQFNTYTMVWTPTEVTFFFNGREVHTVPATTLHTSSQQVSNVLINMQMNSWATSSDDFNSTDFTLDVDYVRLLRPANNDFSHLVYKTTNEAMNHDISQPTPHLQTLQNPNDNTFYTIYRNLNDATTYPKVSSAAGSIALAANASGAATTRVFYRGLDDHLYLATNGRGSTWAVTALPFAAGYEVRGDVTYNANLQLVVYKGADGRLQGYYPNSPAGPWAHTWLTDSASPPVSGEAGAISHRLQDGHILYRTATDELAVLATSAAYYAQSSPGFPPATTLTNDSANPTATLAGGDVLWDQYSANIIYRGRDGRLQVYYQDNGQLTHTWIDADFSTSTRLLAAKPSTLVNLPSGIYYVDQNDKISRFAYDGATNSFAHTTLLDAATYDNVGYYQGARVKGGLVGSPDGTHLFYQGYDGRLQSLYLAGGQWFHSWVDDYWDTGAFSSFTNQAPGLASVMTDNNRTFYCDAYQHLRYFGWEPASITECNNPQASLARVAAPATAHVPAPAAAAEVLDLSVAPNPTAGQLTITLPTALRALSLPYTLTSALGAVVQQGSLAAGHLTLALGSLPSGLYVLTTQAPGHVYHTRVVKE